MTAAGINEEAPPDERDETDDGRRVTLSSARPRPGLGTLVVAIALVPVIVAPIRALARGWVAIGDNGLLLLRAQDVLTADHPLLGSWTSASLGVGETINNPGPLWFDVLAPFVKIGGPSVGFALGVMVANAVAIIVAAWAGRRAGGTPGMLVVTLLSASLSWSMGSELLFDAWQPHAMLLPFWAVLVLAWALGTGDLVAAPVLVGGASLIVQTHISFVYVLVGVVAASVVAAVWTTRSDRRSAGSVAGPSLRRTLVTSAGVAIVAWIQPLIDQVAGEGNLASLIAARTSGHGNTVGLRLGTRLVASVVALPPWWGRSGFSETIVGSGAITEGGRVDISRGNVAGGVAAVLGLLAVYVALGAVVVCGLRRRSRPIVVLAVLGGVAVAAALLTAAVSPVTVVGLGPHQMRWLWPISMLVPASVAVAVAGAAPRRFVRATGVVGVGFFAVMALPTYAAPEGPTRERDFTATVVQLLDQLEDYEPDGAVLYDTSVLRFADPYSGPTFAALARNGVDIVVADEGWIRQLGAGREADGTETVRLFQVEGEAADAAPPGARRIAYANGLDEAERSELERLRVWRLVERAETGTVDAPADQQANWDRLAELESRRARFTVALFEAPLPPGGSAGGGPVVGGSVDR